MGKVCPVGVIHEWAQGPMIKAHDPLPPYSSGWIPVKTNARFDQIGREADATAREIIGCKVPINGEKCLDHEINLFGEAEGGNFFNSDEFKKSEGWYGAGRYAFRNKFSELFMKNDMNLSEAIANALNDANKDAGGDRVLDKLSDETKKEIRKQVRADFKSDPDIINEEKALQLLDIVKRTRDQVKEGLDFKDPEKKAIYDEFKKLADSLPEEYKLMSEKRMTKFDAVDMIEGAFQDNWGVRESCKDYAQKKFDEYVKKYSDRITQDSLDEQMKMYGVTIDMTPDEFYSKIYAKAKNQDYSFLEKYVGKEITIITDWSGTHRVRLFWKTIKAVDDNETTHDELTYKRDDGLELNLIERLKSGGVKLSKDYDEFGGGFKDLIYLRFMKHYNKSVEGDWTMDHLPAIQNLENIINELPDGHFKTNDELNLITNKDYSGGDHGGYAWYSANEKRINLSAKCVERAADWGVLGKPTEFKSVMLHEIGHAVDKKIGGKATYDYKKFTVECGWSYQQEELRRGLSATGDQKNIPRGGSNASVTLITDYSHKSPSEAFAEYYSFYNLNKEHFDKYFKTNDRTVLNVHSRITAKSVSSEQPISKMLPHRVDKMSLDHWSQYKEVERGLSERGDEHSITLNSPWTMGISQEEKVKLHKPTIKLRKDYSIHSMPPVVAVKDGMNRLVIDGGVRLEVAKMNKQLVPCIEITKEQYYALRGKGMKDTEIADCVYTQHADDFVPKQIAPAVRVNGLIYRDALIPMDVILDNHGVLKTMSDICGSPELQKAMEDVFEKGVYVNDDENRKLGRVGQHYGMERGNTNQQKSNTLTESILAVMDPEIERIAKLYEDAYAKEHDRSQMGKYDKELTRLSLVWNLVKAINVYTKPTDVLSDLSSRVGNNGSFVVEASINRDGQRYHFHTEVIYAGGYNIQQLHFRYLTNTRLPKTNNTEEADKIKEKIQKLTKVQKLNKEIESYTKRVVLYKQEVETAKKLTDDEILQQSENYMRLNVDWDEIVSRGAAVNFNNSKETYDASKLKYRQQTLDSFKQLKIKSKEENVKSLEKEIGKMKAKVTELK